MEKNKKNDKLDKKAKSKQDIENAKKELENMLKQVEEQYGVDREQIKVVKIKLPGRSAKNIILDTIMTLVFNIILILSISGYIIWTKASPLELLYFAIAYSVIEIVLKNILNIFFVKLIIKSFGLITIVPSIVAILLVIIITNFVTITSSLRYIVMFVLVIFLRTLIRSLLTKYRKG
jgi:tryptophan-rich sensory protein